jgi:hypothetical protein
MLSANGAWADQILWEGNTGGYTVRWTTADLTAQKIGSYALAFSLKPLVQRGFTAYQAAMANDNAGQCVYERRFEVISVVGPLIGFRDRYYASCAHEAHPAVSSRLTTIDLSQRDEGGYKSEADEPLVVDLGHPGKITKLSSLFTEKEILGALIKSSVLAAQVNKEARSLSELLDGLYGEEFQMPHSPCEQSMPRDILTRFAMHHLEKTGIAVRLALEPTGGACQPSQADLGLLLPVPQNLREALRRADQHKEGFLQSGGRKAGETIIHFSLVSGRRNANKN